MQANQAIGLAADGLLAQYPKGTDIPTSAAVGAVNMLYAEHVLTQDEAEFWMGAVNTNMEKYGPAGVRHMIEFAKQSSNISLEQYQRNMPKMSPPIETGGSSIMIDQNPNSPSFGQPITTVQHTTSPEFNKAMISVPLGNGETAQMPRDEAMKRFPQLFGTDSGASPVHSAGETVPGQVAPLAGGADQSGVTGPGAAPGPDASRVGVELSPAEQALATGRAANVLGFEKQLQADQDTADKTLYNVGNFERLMKDSTTGPHQTVALPAATVLTALGWKDAANEVAGGNYDHIKVLAGEAINSAIAEARQMGGTGNRDLSAEEFEQFRQGHGGVYDTPGTLHELFDYMSKFAMVKKEELKAWQAWKKSGKDPQDFMPSFETYGLPKLSKKYNMHFKLVSPEEDAKMQEQK